MDTPRRPHRVSLFAKFTAVILLLGIVPIVLLVTVLQSRMLTEYRASLEDAYQDAIAYSAYSIRVRLDTYTDLSKFCYYYNYSSQGDFSYDYDNYDNLRKILSGEAFADTDNVADSIRHEMGLFLHYMNMTPILRLPTLSMPRRVRPRWSATSWETTITPCLTVRRICKRWILRIGTPKAAKWG